MLKIEITPSFTNACSIEIKPNGEAYQLLIIQSSYAHTKSPGTAWHGVISEPATVNELVDRLQANAAQPSERSYFVIADGIRIQAQYEVPERKVGIDLRSPEQGSPESIFVQKIMDLCEASIRNADLHQYFTELKTYF